jgi:hypothetical protein
MNMIFGGRVLHFIMQGAYDSGDTENISLNITLTESWQEIEWQWIMNTPGQANGSMAAWLGTTQVFSQTGREYRGPNPGTVASDGLNNGSNNHVNNVRLYAQFGQGTIYLDRVATGNTRIGTTGQSPPLTLSPSTQPSGQVSVPYLGTTVTADGIAPRTFSASGLPPGVLLSTTGAWSGTPSAPGTFSTLVGATDSSVPARQGSITYPIVINPVAGDINTRNKRESSYSIAFPCFRVRPLPDGSLATTADRTHMAYQYAGITPVMAGPINTRNKRQSCYSLAFPAFRVRPNPDGSLANADDRTHMAYEYAGITTAAIPPGGRDGTIGRGTFKGIGLGMR